MCLCKSIYDSKDLCWWLFSFDVNIHIGEQVFHCGGLYSSDLDVEVGVILVVIIIQVHVGVLNVFVQVVWSYLRLSKLRLLRGTDELLWTPKQNQILR
jgi:hypothetical protein